MPADVRVVLQGSVVDPDQAEWAVGDGVADVVEMTRAMLADPDLARKLAAGEAPRPCIRCNQTCQVRDARNPIVTCVGEPTTGRETEDPDWYQPAVRPREVLVVGGGPTGLECARVAALRGHVVHLVEQSERLGGVAAVAGPGQPLVAWLDGECRSAGVTVSLGATAEPSDLEAADVVVLATGSRPGLRSFEVEEGAVVLDVLDVARRRRGRRRAGRDRGDLGSDRGADRRRAGRAAR